MPVDQCLQHRRDVGLGDAVGRLHDHRLVELLHGSDDAL